MAIQGICLPSPPSHSHSPYYQLLERGSARLGLDGKKFLIHMFYVGVVGESNNSNDWAMPPAGQLNYVSTKFCP